MFFQLSRFDKSISVLQIFIRSIEDGCFGMVALLLISQKWCIRSHGRLRRQGKKTTRTGSLNWADTFDNDNIMPYQDLTRTQWLTNKNSNKKNRQAHHLLYMYGTEQKQFIKHLTFLQKKPRKLDFIRFRGLPGSPAPHHGAILDTHVLRATKTSNPNRHQSTWKLSKCEKTCVLYHIISYHV